MNFFGEGRCARSSNSTGLIFKSDTIKINHHLNSAGQGFSIWIMRREYEHEIWSYRMSAKASNNHSFWRVKRDSMS